MMAHWTPEMDEYIRINTKFYGNRDLMRLINEKFGTDLTIEDIENYKRENGLFHGHTVKYTPEIREFIFKNISGHTAKELAGMLEDEFGVHFSENSIAYFKGKNGLQQRGIATSLLTPAEEEYVRKNFRYKSNPALTAELNELFGESFTVTQIANWKSRHGLKSGLVGKFTKAEIGEMRQQGDFMFTKIGHGAGNRNWQYSHRLLWESVYGPIPKNKALIFLDGDHKNVTLENLALVDRAIQVELARGKFYAVDKELTKAGIAISKLNIAVRERRREAAIISEVKKKQRKPRAPKQQSQRFGKFTQEIQQYIIDNFGVVPTYDISDLVYGKFGVRIGRSTIRKWISATGISGQTNWTDDINARLAELWSDHTAAECSKILNDEFGLQLNFSAVSKHATWLKLKKLNPNNKMTPEIEQFLRDNADSYTNPELTEMINKKFGTEFNDISAYKSKFGLVDHPDPADDMRLYKMLAALDLLRGTDDPEIPRLKEEAVVLIDRIRHEKRRTDLKLRYISDFSYEQIADYYCFDGIAINTSAIQKRISRHLKSLARRAQHVN